MKYAIAMMIALLATACSEGAVTDYGKGYFQCSTLDHKTVSLDRAADIKYHRTNASWEISDTVDGELVTAHYTPKQGEFCTVKS